MPPRHGLVAPEAVPLDLPEATVGSRGAAVLVDWMLQGALYIGLALAAAAATDAPGMPGWAPPTVTAVLTLLVLFGYPIAFETAWRGGGRSPGKALMGLRVVTVEGAPVRFRHAAVRAALGLVDFIATIGVAAVATSVLSPRNQRLGDYAAGTVVLRERSGAGVTLAVEFAVPDELRDSADALDVSAVGPRGYAAVRAFLLRADVLPPDRRDEIGGALLDAVAPHLGDVVGGLPPHLVLEAVAARYQRRQRAASTDAAGDGSALSG